MLHDLDAARCAQIEWFGKSQSTQEAPNYTRGPNSSFWVLFRGNRCPTCWICTHLLEFIWDSALALDFWPGNSTASRLTQGSSAVEGFPVGRRNWMQRWSKMSKSVTSRTKHFAIVFPILSLSLILTLLCICIGWNGHEGRGTGRCWSWNSTIPQLFAQEVLKSAQVAVIFTRRRWWVFAQSVVSITILQQMENMQIISRKGSLLDVLAHGSEPGTRRQKITPATKIWQILADPSHSSKVQEVERQWKAHIDYCYILIWWVQQNSHIT